MKTDPRVDQYIARAPAFAQPILEETRARIQKACPSAEETIKWNVPFYLLGGKLLASMAAFKQHAKVGVWIGKKPTFVDVAKVAELPAASVFAAQLKSAASVVTGGAAAAPVKKAPSAKKATAPKKPSPAKPAPTVKKASAGAKSAPAKKVPAAKAAPATRTQATKAKKK